MGSLFRGLGRDKEFQALLGVVLILLIAGTSFYHVVEGWRVLDSLYFCITTLTTVGLGDLSPVTDLGKLFTMLYALLGIGIFLAFINTVAHHAQRQNPLNQLLTKPTKKTPHR